MPYRFGSFINKFLSHNVILSLHSNEKSSIWVSIGECVCPNKIVIFSVGLNKKTSPLIHERKYIAIQRVQTYRPTKMFAQALTHFAYTLIYA